MKGTPYQDDVLITAGACANGVLAFIGANAALQRGEFTAGPWASIVDDAKKWADLSVWVTKQGEWNILAGVPILILRVDRMHAAWTFARVGGGYAGENNPVLVRDVQGPYGLAAYIPPACMTYAANLYLRLRGWYEKD